MPQGTHAVGWGCRENGECVRTAHTLYAATACLIWFDENMKRQKIIVPYGIVSPSDIIFTLDFLSNNELQTARSCHEDIQDILHTSERIKSLTCFSQEDFTQAKKEIQNYSEKGFSPLIHIHGHGNREKGVKLPQSDKYISWEEWLDFFRSIKPQNGNLTIIMSCCYSYTIVNLFYKKETLHLPFAFFYGYESEISSGIVEDEVKCINNSLFKDDGKSLMDIINDMYIKPFSEFDYMNNLISIILTENDIGKKRNNLVLKMPKTKASSTRRYFNYIFRDNPVELIDKLAQQVIQNPNRREIYLDKIKEQISC